MNEALEQRRDDGDPDLADLELEVWVQALKENHLFF